MSEPPPALRLSRLTLSQFRNYGALTWRPGARVAAIFGPNGGGKTNLLEAVSLLGASRGLRAARLPELARQGADGKGAFAVAGRFETPPGRLDVGTGTVEDDATRRAFRIDGVAPRSRGEIATRIALVWLTPPMDRLFQEGASGRRRFLDRLVAALEPAQARELGAHDAALAERNRLLREGRADPAWLAALEDAIARHATAVTAARAVVVRRLNAVLAAQGAGGFPAARLTLLSPIADRLAGAPALAAEEWLRAELARARAADAAEGGTRLGAHKADFQLADLASGLPAALSSTGQQKALLIGVVLGHAALVADARGFAPILLLDEPMVHLDAERRAAFAAALRGLPAQALITGTDRETFLPFAAFAAGWHCADGTLRPDPAFHFNENGHFDENGPDEGRQDEEGQPALRAPALPSGFCAPQGL